MSVELGEIVGWRNEVRKPMTFRGKDYFRGDTFPSAIEEEDPRKVQGMIDSGKIKRTPITAAQLAESINDPSAEERRAQILAAGAVAAGQRPSSGRKTKKEASGADQDTDD